MRSNYYLKYDGISTRDMGDIIVTKSSVASRPRRKQEVINVPGRNGNIVLYQDAYEDVQKSYEIVAGSGRDGSTGSKFYEIAAWLMPEDTEPTIDDYINLTLNGYKHLVDGSDPSYTLLARVTNGFDVDQILTRAGRASISFSCRPERYLSDSFLPIIADSSQTKSGKIVRIDNAILGENLQIMAINLPYNANGYTGLTIAKTGRNFLRYPYQWNSFSNYNKSFVTNANGSVTLTTSGSGPASLMIGYPFTPAIDANDLSTVHVIPGGSLAISAIPADAYNEDDRAFIQYKETEQSVSYQRSIYGGQTATLDIAEGFKNTMFALQSPTRSTASFTAYPSIMYAADASEGWESPTDNNFYDVNWAATAGTIYGGSYDALTGTLTSKYDSAGNELSPWETYQLTASTIPVIATDRYIWAYGWVPGITPAVGSITVKYKSYQVITNPMDRKAKPIIKVNCPGSGTLTIGDVTMTFTGLTDYVYVDSETENCFRTLSENMNSHVSVSGGFPILSPGDNNWNFTGDITSIEIWPRWWKL